MPADGHALGASQPQQSQDLTIARLEAYFVYSVSLVMESNFHTRLRIVVFQVGACFMRNLDALVLFS
jgi:hypothetical protein